MPWWVFHPSGFQSGSEAGKWEVARTASKFISRSKESTVQNKHTLHFFAALGGAQKEQEAGLEQELQPQNYNSTLALDTHILTYSGGICETLHEYILAIYNVNTASVKHKCMHINSGKQSCESKNQTMTC